MQNNKKEERYQQLVENRFQVYNSLFMSLPYDKMSNIGMLIPFLFEESKTGYEEGKTPIEIVDEFFADHTEITSEDEQIDLLFRFIQYIERQVVLFDAIEDVSFSDLHDNSDIGTVVQLQQSAKEQDKIKEVQKKLENFDVRVVFTAHPTQFYSNSVQRIMHDLRNEIDAGDITDIDLLLQQLGLTPFINKEKPTPYDEAVSIIFYLRYVYYDTLGELLREMRDLFGNDWAADNPHVFKLGFWPGGDRDGNPFVTAETTWKVAEQLRIAILKCYYNHIKYLRRRLTYRGVEEPLKALSQQLYDNVFNGRKDLDINTFLNEMNTIREKVSTEYNGLFVDKIDDFMGRVKMFGTHFASLDIRQDSSKHLEIISQIFKQEFGVDYTELSDEEKIDFLTQKSLTINPDHYTDELTQDTLKNVYQVKDIQAINGERGLHRYVISNCETIFDVLHVYALFKYCGYKEGDINMDIIPLFETIKGLDEAQDTMRKLYQLPVYANHLKQRHQKQTIMLGFSDGTKDGGYVKANWEIYRTKEKLTKVSEENDIEVIFFDGRGGPPARGGGKTHQFYAAQGNTIANNAIELTIQGQTITSVFGTHDQAKFNFEQLLTAGIKNEVFSDYKTEITSDEREILNDLAQLSYQKYAALKADDKFVPYLENVSTVKYYGRTNIGSRPSKRGNSEQLRFQDLRAIPFVGSWSLLKQNVPGYYGLGTAIKSFKDKGQLDKVSALYKNSEFFRTLIENSMMSMTKTYFPLTAYMKNDPVYGQFWQNLHNEFELSKQMVLEITGYHELMQDEPISRDSIRIREKIVLPLLTIQQYALQKIQQGSDKSELYEKMVTRSLFGNINASRNSA